jgi:hypothetical protein
VEIRKQFQLVMIFLQYMETEEVSDEVRQWAEDHPEDAVEAAIRGIKAKHQSLPEKE